MVSLKHYTQCPLPSEAEASFYSLSLLLLFNGFVLCQLCMCVSVCVGVYIHMTCFFFCIWFHLLCSSLSRNSKEQTKKKNRPACLANQTAALQSQPTDLLSLPRLAVPSHSDLKANLVPPRAPHRMNQVTLLSPYLQAQTYAFSLGNILSDTP